VHNFCRDVEKQKKKRSKVKQDDQAVYVDSNRNMAVVMGDKELSKALKHFDREVCVEDRNTGIVNSAMYMRQALHFGSKKQHEAAKKYLESGEPPPPHHVAAHFLSPDDPEVLSCLGETCLLCGDSRGAQAYALQVLAKDPRHVRAITVRAESLYSTCQVDLLLPPPYVQFEHGLAQFLRGVRLAPDSADLQRGVTKCRKAILGKVGDENVFFFHGSKNLIDFLRQEGVGGVARW
jgi:hypothetical protein